MQHKANTIKAQLRQVILELFLAFIQLQFHAVLQAFIGYNLQVPVLSALSVVPVLILQLQLPSLAHQDFILQEQEWQNVYHAQQEVIVLQHLLQYLYLVIQVTTV